MDIDNCGTTSEPTMFRCSVLVILVSINQWIKINWLKASPSVDERSVLSNLKLGSLLHAFSFNLVCFTFVKMEICNRLFLKFYRILKFSCVLDCSTVIKYFQNKLIDEYTHFDFLFGIALSGREFAKTLDIWERTGMKWKSSKETWESPWNILIS